MIRHDGDYLNREQCVSAIFDTNIEIWWHCDYVNINKISDLPEGVYIRKSHKTKKCQALQNIVRCLY